MHIILKYRNSIIIIFSVLCICLPFCKKAYFIDDMYHVTMARGVLKAPMRPYDFTFDFNKEGIPMWESGSKPSMLNPPFMHYYLALVIAVMGDELWKIRIGFIVISIMTALGIYVLARRFTVHPLYAASLCIMTPVFLVSTNSLSPDICMTALIVWGMEFFLRAWDSEKIPYLILSGLLFGCALLTKYTALPYMFLIVLWAALHWSAKSKQKYLFVIVIPLIILCAWSIWNIMTYGEPHYIAAARRIGMFHMESKIFIGLIFLSGITLFPAVYYVVLYARYKMIFFATVGITAVLMFLCPIFFSDILFINIFLMVFFLINSIIMFLILSRNFSKDNAFMLIWVYAGFFLTLLPIPWIAGRYFMIIIPPLAILTARVIERELYASRFTAYIKAGVLSISCIGSLCLAVSDYLHAETFRLIGRDVEMNRTVQHTNKKKYFIGDYGFGYAYYLSEKGWIMYRDKQELKKGDLLLKPLYAIPGLMHTLNEVQKITLARIPYSFKYAVRVMDVSSSAGFYASLTGFLPFSISTNPFEVFTLYEVH